MMKRSFKIGLATLLFGFVGFVGFGYCDTVWNSADNTVGLGNYGTYNLTAGSCIKPYAGNGCERGFKIYDTSDNLVYNGTSLSNGFEGFICVDFDGYLKNENFTNCTYSFHLSDGCTVDTGSILSGSCDINYCVENGLCPTSSGSWSELMINDIVHESAPFINISIPYEYAWDYTVDENEFNLVVSGYNVDYEYIDGIIRTQQSKPNQVDFNNIVSGLIPLLIPGLVIILFIYFVFRFIKKIF